MDTSIGQTGPVAQSKSAARNPRTKTALRYLRILMFIIALALPLLSLAVLGSLWLWQKGYVLYWATGALVTTTLAFAVERWLLRDMFDKQHIAAASSDHISARELKGREAAAWQAVVALSEDISPQAIDSRDAFLDLGKKTIDVVARHMHPDHKDPVYRFTLPELLALIAKVSADLGPFVRDTIPLGDRLTVGQVMVIYRWRGVLDYADKAYDVWRIIRLMNPATAVAQELREKFTRQLYEWGRNEAARRLNRAYVREIGRAAIDLYSGRLRFADEVAPTGELAVVVDSLVHSSSSADRGPESATGVEPTLNAPSQTKRRGVRPIFKQLGNAARLIFRRNDDRGSGNA